MRQTLKCEHCGDEWDEPHATADDAQTIAETFSRLHEKCGTDEVPQRDVISYPRMSISPGFSDDSLIFSHKDFDASLPMYEMIFDSGKWNSFAICDGGKLLKSSEYFEECKDAIQEHFMDACDAQANTNGAVP